MLEVVLTRLWDFSCKATTLGEPSTAGQGPRGDSPIRTHPLRNQSSTGGNVDIASAMAWLRRELMEMRWQDQVLIRQLMELHSGIHELKQELSEEEPAEEALDVEDDTEGGFWNLENERGSSGVYPSSGEMGPSVPVFRTPLRPRRRWFNRRSSMP